MIFSFAKGALVTGPSGAGPVLFCVTDAGIDRTPFEREGLAIVTRGALDVMAVTGRRDC